MGMWENEHAASGMLMPIVSTKTTKKPAQYAINACLCERNRKHSSHQRIIKLKIEEFKLKHMMFFLV
jgi:hypothetical protein